jgi:uncharacterized protein (DUF4415 family)
MDDGGDTHVETARGSLPRSGRQEIQRRGRGRQKASTKQMISLRLDVDVVEKFRATGKGWRVRMNATLATHASRRAPATPR